MPIYFPESPDFGVFFNEDKTLTIKEYKGISTTVEIPEKIGVFTVTKIAPDFCRNTANVYCVHMPDSITEIGDGAFYGCYDLAKINLSEKLKEIPRMFCGLSNISSINIPDTVTRIGADAFRDCKSLKIADIGKNTEFIDILAFSNCDIEELHIGPNLKEINYSLGFLPFNYNLKTITVDKNNSSFREIDGILFSKNEDTLIRFPECAVKPSTNAPYVFYSVPNSVKNIAKLAFAGCCFDKVKFTKDVEGINECFSYSFIYNPDALIICKEGSTAEKFAKKNKIKTQLIGKSINDFLEEVSESEQKSK